MSDATPASPSTPLKRTPFYDFHVAAGGRMVPYAGWEMPLMYTSIGQERKQCRESGAFFDVSHMGRLRFEGADVQAFLQRVVTRDVSKMQPGQSRYGFVTNANGGVMDDVIVGRSDGGNGSGWSMVCNASNRHKLLGHFTRVIGEEGHDARVVDVTEQTAMAALQGPKVMAEVADFLTEAVGQDVMALKKFGFARGEYMGSGVEVYRSGYTGEDGVGLVIPAGMAQMLVGMVGSSWNKPDATIRPGGLGARDTLRIEAGLPLYGHELTEEINVLSSGMGWAVATDKADGSRFIGFEAVREASQLTDKKVLVGLELDGRRTARQGQPVLLNDVLVGEVTSGTMSPSLGKSIAMAYIASDYSGFGTELGVDFKREVVQSRVVSLPFYKREG